MIAVDAGVHLASIVRILQQSMPLYSKEKPPAGYTQTIQEGPFAGVKCHGYSARANALHIFRELMHAFLITHPHLDHLSGLGVNTPALEYGREAKTIIALDSTIEAIKNHVFNDSIWPNLSDEGSGVGFVTYRRLKEGGNHRLGSGEARGYVRVCDSLSTLCMGVTHGKCKPKPAITTPHHRNESSGWHEAYTFPQRRLSRISDHESYFAAVHSHSHNPSMSSSSIHPPPGQTTPGYSALHTPGLASLDTDHFEPVKSSAFFILNEETTSEVLIFGDIEPDGVSLSPQNYKVWRTAAPKVANGSLRAIFIECSYDDSVKDTDLYGHLCPRHLVGELLFLAREVAEVKAAKNVARVGSPLPTTENKKRPVDAISTVDTSRKRKKTNGSAQPSTDGDQTLSVTQSPALDPTSGYVGTRSSTSARRKNSMSNIPARGDISPISLRAQSPSRIPQSTKHVHFSGPTRSSIGSLASPSPQTQPVNHPASSLGMHALHGSAVESTDNGYSERQPDPMEGLTIHIIHVKDTLTDGPSPGEIILKQLADQAKDAGLACDFHVTDFGESIWI